MSGLIKVQAELTQEQFDMLTTLAKQRGVSANTALVQAITTETLLADNVAAGDEIIIKHPDSRTTRILTKTATSKAG